MIGLSGALILISMFLLNQFWTAENKAEEARSEVSINADLVEEELREIKSVMNTGKTKAAEQEDEIDYLNLSQNILDKLNKENDTDKIIAYLDTGENGIREIIAHDPDSDFYNRRDIHGNSDHSGTVFLYHKNESSLDPYTTYYGHNMQNGTRLYKLTDYAKFKDYLQTATLYTYEGILEYELVSIANPNDAWYKKVVTWEKTGVKDYFYELAENSRIIERLENYEEDARYMFLSTCFEADGKSKLVAVYKLTEHKK